MASLAVKYGLSDVGLRKICKKMRIPLPPQGYHLRKSKEEKTDPRKGLTPGSHVHEEVWAEFLDKSANRIRTDKLDKAFGRM